MDAEPATYGTMDDDTEINTRFALGDEAAVRAVYQRYGGAMFAIARHTFTNASCGSRSTSAWTTTIT